MTRLKIKIQDLNWGRDSRESTPPIPASPTIPFPISQASNWTTDRKIPNTKTPTRGQQHMGE